MAAIDQQKNNISLFNVFDQITVPVQVKDEIKSSPQKNASVRLEHEIVLLWRRVLPPLLCDSEINTDVKISVIDPVGKVLGEILTTLRFEIGKRILRQRIQNNALIITTEGDYVYQAEIMQPNTKSFSAPFRIPFYVHFT